MKALGKCRKRKIKSKRNLILIPGLRRCLKNTNHCNMLKIPQNRLIKTISLVTLSGLMMCPLVFAARDQNAQEKGRDKEQREQKMEKKEKSKNKDAAAIPNREKLGHLRRAAKHLEAAGNNELAGKVRNQIKGMEGKTSQPKAKEQGPRARQGSKANKQQDLARRPDQKRRVDGPRRMGKPQERNFNPAAQGPPNINAELMKEIREMRGQMGELRNQVRRLESTRERPADAPKPPMEARPAAP